MPGYLAYCCAGEVDWFCYESFWFPYDFGIREVVVWQRVLSWIAKLQYYCTVSRDRKPPHIPVVFVEGLAVALIQEVVRASAPSAKVSSGWREYLALFPEDVSSVDGFADNLDWESSRSWRIWLEVSIAADERLSVSTIVLFGRFARSSLRLYHCQFCINCSGLASVSGLWAALPFWRCTLVLLNRLYRHIFLLYVRLIPN